MIKFDQLRVAFRLIGQAFRYLWEDWANNVLISLLAILASLTLLFAGPAVMGVCVVGADLADGVRTGIAGWWTGFKAYFWQGVTYGMVNLALLTVFAISLWFYTEIDTIWAPLLAIALIFFGILWGFVQFYTPGYLVAQEEKSLALAWKNSLLTVLSAPIMSLVLGSFALGVALFSVGLFLPLFFGTMPLLGLLSVLAARDRFAGIPAHEDRENAAD